MVTPIRFELTDDQRKALRLAMGRKGGLATRKEVKAWASHLLAQAVEGLPQGPPQRPQEKGECRPPSKAKARFEAAQAAPEDASCAHCGTLKERHGRMGFTCPPVIGKPKGRMFEREGA
jgi:hypothetical protein